MAGSLPAVCAPAVTTGHAADARTATAMIVRSLTWHPAWNAPWNGSLCMEVLGALALHVSGALTYCSGERETIASHRDLSTEVERCTIGFLSAAFFDCPPKSQRGGARQASAMIGRRQLALTLSSLTVQLTAASCRNGYYACKYQR